MTTATLDRNDAVTRIDPSTLPVGAKLALVEFTEDPDAAKALDEGDRAGFLPGYHGRDGIDLISRVRAMFGRPQGFANLLQDQGIDPSEVAFELVKDLEQVDFDAFNDGLIGPPEYWVAREGDANTSLDADGDEGFRTTDLVFTRVS